MVPPPETTALGGIRTHLARGSADPHASFQPSNITWACMPPHANRRLKKRERYAALSVRALNDFDAWFEAAPLVKVSSLLKPPSPRDVPDPVLAEKAARAAAKDQGVVSTASS